MKSLHFKARAKVAIVLAASTGIMAAGNLATSRPAGADPSFITSYAGVGSDTLQDLMNAYSGAVPYPPNANTVYQIPLDSGAASGHKTLVSFDAIPAGGSAASPGCITTKVKAGSFDRPNGSGNGIHALSRAIDGGAWNASVGPACPGGAGNVSGSVDFARVSREPNSTVAGGALTWIPFIEDAVGVAYYDHSTGNLATSITTAALTTLYSSATGTITINGDTVLGCLPQSGSGTRAAFEKSIGVTDAQAAAAATAAGCNGTSTSPPVEENNGNEFYAFASAKAVGTDAVVPFSSGSWVAQADGKATDNTATARANGVDLATINDTPGNPGKPYSGVAPNETPVQTYWNSNYARNLYVVVSTARINGFPGDSGLKGLFRGATSAICSAGAQATAKTFGFLPMTAAQGTCGDITKTAPLDA